MISSEKVKELAEIMKDYELTEIEYEGKDEKLCLKREKKMERPPMPPHGMMVPPMPMSFAPQTAAAPGVGEAAGSDMVMAAPAVHSGAPSGEGKVVKAPLVGTFYAAPGVDKAPYIKVGDHVKKGQIIGIIEAMKLMNEIESEVDGVVTEVLAENGKMVEFGQVLIKLS